MLNGFTTFVIVLEGRAAGVRTTDMSRPPEASIGATSKGNWRRCLWEGGRGVYGGQIARARTSCEWRRREMDWTQRWEVRERREEVVVEGWTVVLT